MTSDDPLIAEIEKFYDAYFEQHWDIETDFSPSHLKGELLQFIRERQKAEKERMIHDLQTVKAEIMTEHENILDTEEEYGSGHERLIVVVEKVIDSFIGKVRGEEVEKKE